MSFPFSQAVHERIYIGRWRARRATLRGKRATYTAASWGPSRLTAVSALVCGLLCAAPGHAAKPEKPDKVEKPKPDKVEKALKSERNSQTERAFSAPPSKKFFNRSEKSSSRGSNPAPLPSAAPVPEGSGFERFQLITERNIFNPNRVARSRETPPEPPRTDTVALVGVLQSDEGVVAFFHSENRFLQQIVREGETVGGLSVMRIMPNGVELMQDGQPLFVRVNQQLRRVEGGSWKPLPRDMGRTEIARPADGSSVSAIPPGASEVLRRLMEQRQKQLKQ